MICSALVNSLLGAAGRVIRLSAGVLGTEGVLGGGLAILATAGGAGETADGFRCFAPWYAQELRSNAAAENHPETRRTFLATSMRMRAMNDAKTQAANRPPFRKFALAGCARKNTFGV
jgi:hypothetical protein